VIRPEAVAELTEAVTTAEPVDQKSENFSRMSSTPPADIVIDPAAPVDAARLFIRHNHEHQGVPTILNHQSEFVEWRDGCYRPLDDGTIRAELYTFAESAKQATTTKSGGVELVPFKATKPRVDFIADALRAVANVPAHISPPAYLNCVGIGEPHEILAHQGGLLHLPSGSTFAPDPRFFTRNALSFTYDPDAPPPVQWLSFLNDLWENDPEHIETLQELFGYLLTEDTRQQKLFLIVGPKRSGKGTIARVLAALRGADSVAGPTLASLSTNFGLASLIGKPVAIVADARLSGRADQAVIAERLLSVSGEDGLTIDRKYLPAWTGKLSTRFVILTNELPRLADASGALASRFIVLRTRQSFYGGEDVTLTDRLLTELPGILNWALEGYRRLTERGYFLQPQSTADDIRELGDLGSPIGAFVRDCCIVEPGRSVPVDDLYDAWKRWCVAEGRDHPGTVQTFGRDLRAAEDGIKTSRPRIDGTRLRFYEGIDLAN
jgi:putative DNA primase/helicase